MADLRPEFRLETARLILRDWRADDFGALHDLCTCPEVMATIGPLHDEQKTRDLLARLQERTARNGHTFWAMERKADGDFLGYCGFGPITAEAAPADLQGTTEIGWTLRADCWGQGYATEAARAVLALVFERFGSPEVCSQTSEANRGSWRVMERLGMERAEALDYEDPAYPPEENPTKVYRLTREAWAGLRG